MDFGIEDMSKKGLQPPSTIVIVILFIIGIAILIILSIYFSQSTSGSKVFNYATNWSSGLKWT